MVFHVAGALHVVGLEAGAFEFAEQRRVGFVHHVDQRVQPAAVRHADDDLLHARLGGGFDDGVQCGNADLGAFKPEALGGDEALLAERLEAFRLGQLLQDRALRFGAGERCASGAPSTRRWIQAFWSGSWMCMNSTPIGPQ